MAQAGPQEQKSLEAILTSGDPPCIVNDQLKKAMDTRELTIEDVEDLTKETFVELLQKTYGVTLIQANRAARAFKKEHKFAQQDGGVQDEKKIIEDIEAENARLQEELDRLKLEQEIPFLESWKNRSRWTRMLGYFFIFVLLSFAEYGCGFLEAREPLLAAFLVTFAGTAIPCCAFESLVIFRKLQLHTQQKLQETREKLRDLLSKQNGATQEAIEIVRSNQYDK